jgi:1-acyl-sn-glycerol-3-phosphate acyltransferase
VIPGRGKEALQAAHELLKKGNSVVIFPEAKLTNTHDVARSGTGVARLALAALVPILPIGFYAPPRYLKVFHGHARDGRPTVGSWQTKGRCYIQIGQPIAVPEERVSLESYRFFRRFTGEIMERVATLAQEAELRAGAIEAARRQKGSANRTNATK